MLHMDGYHEAMLRKIFGIQPGNDIPEAIATPYWKIKRACDRMGAPLTTDGIGMLALVCDAIGAAEIPENVEETFLNVIRRGEAVQGDVVMATFAGHLHFACLLGPNAYGDIQVEIDGEKRVVAPDAVRHMTDSERALFEKGGKL
jgi:hypothetical protein